MRFSTTTISLLASTAAAFSDSSPLVLFSTSKLLIPAGETSQLQSTSRALHTTHDILASCPTSRYVLISQPNVHASDLRNPHSGVCHSANLCSAVDGQAVRGRYDVAEVIGDDISLDGLSNYIQAACAEQGKKDGLAVEGHRLEALPAQKGEARATKLAENGEHSSANVLQKHMTDRKADVEIGGILSDTQASGDDYTVIYFSSPHSSAVYKSEYVESAAIQMELKRQTGDIVEPRAGNASDRSAPLFVKYQFFTPGIFMGIVALIIMLSLLYVGLSAVASLEVSYGAFDKENGPAAQKKNN
ncbi:putative er protein big1 [Diaporthe ampelina]|uniref:Protein BIG1 n=1 Tax=Diaporthe ampelina TaxID=1214573 RepID=A0A0G2I345_9PEZI|nr:putative er protein big1 [Diaporthe ampelina]